MKIIRDICSNPEKAKLPDMAKRAILPVMRARFLTDLLANVCSTQIFLIRGDRKGTHSNFVTLFFGKEELAHYFSKLLYSGNPKIQFLGETSCSNISSVIAHTKADIVLVHVHMIFSGFFSRKGFLILPIVRQNMNISGSWDAFYARLSRGRRRDIHAIKKIGYVYEVTREPEKFRFFYYKMYLPYILKRHGKSAKPSIFYELKKGFRNGGLLFVKQDGEYLSGLLYAIYDNEVHNVCSGTYEGREDYYANGAVQAARYFLTQWSKQQGYKVIDHGLSNPFMKDGVFTYKKEWGMKVKLNKDIIRSSVYALKLCNFGNEVREFLADNPFIFTDLKSLRGLVFLNSEILTEGKLKNLYRLYSTQGLSDLVVISCLTNDASGMVLKVTSEGRVLEKYSLRKGIPHSLDFLTKFAPNMSFNIYLIDVCASLQPKKSEVSPNLLTGTQNRLNHKSAL